MRSIAGTQQNSCGDMLTPEKGEGACVRYPMNDVYRWDPAEGIIGVVGVAPAATADFFQRLTALTTARKDWEHVRVLIDSNPKLPSRGRHFELGETDPSPFIRSCIDALAARGATVVAVPCNTAHILYDRYAADATVVVPNMVDLAVAMLASSARAMPRRVAVLGSRHTVTHDLYGLRLRLEGGDVVDMTSHQAEVSSLIEHVKQGGNLTVGADRLRKVMQDCTYADAFVIACTELSALVEPAWVDVPVIDASDALARHCLAHARGQIPQPEARRR